MKTIREVVEEWYGDVDYATSEQDQLNDLIKKLEARECEIDRRILADKEAAIRGINTFEEAEAYLNDVFNRD